MTEFAEKSQEWQRGYASGIAQAYRDVFEAFTDEYARTEVAPTSATAVLVHIQAQWREAESTIVARGVL